jgi:dCMP deaminase
MSTTSIIPIDKTRIEGRLVREFWWEGDDVHVIFADDGSHSIFKGAYISNVDYGAKPDFIVEQELIVSQRPSWDEYWLGILDKVAERGTCDRGRSGAILVDGDQQIIATGYVGAPRGLPHCGEAGHLIRQVTYEDGSVHNSCVRTAHAERNAIIQAARRGVKVSGAVLYCTMEPCVGCATDIINVGIRRVIAKHGYHGAGLTRQWFKEAGVELVTINSEPLKY